VELAIPAHLPRVDDVSAYGRRGGGAVIGKLVYPVGPAQIALSARPRQNGKGPWGSRRRD